MPGKYSVVAGSRRIALAGARLIGRANPYATVEVTLKLRRKTKLPEVTGRPKAVLSREAFVEKYGASEQDIEKVLGVFDKLGLNKVDASAASRTVRLSGTVAAMEEAFQVKLFNYSHENGNFRGRVGVVHVPSELEGIVEAVFGLDNRRVTRRRRQPVSDAAHARALASVPSSWYIPSQLASHYDFPSGDGKGQTVGILEF